MIANSVEAGERAVRPILPRRIIPELDKDPQLIARAQTLPGRIVLVVCFAVILLALHESPVIAGLAAACAYSGRYRWRIIPLATLIGLAQIGFGVDAALVATIAAQEHLTGQINLSWLLSGMVVAVFCLCSGLMLVWRCGTAMPVFQRSTLCLVSGFIVLVLIGQSPVCQGAPRVFLWAFLMTFLPYLWFLGYALADVSAGEPSPFWQRLGAFHPFWGSTLTPFGKGVAYLRKFEAKTPAELAVTQLKGLKLAIWACFLSICLRACDVLAHGYLGIPRYDDAFARQLSGIPYPWYSCWASLISFFIEDLLMISIWGGMIIAGARIAGFRLLRNTYRPLEAATIAEFWNRYYFYYKELLVDHFFYPTFFRCFKKHKKLRIFFATFVAACVGNLLFHFLRDIRFIPQLGLVRAVIGEQSHALYTVLLALGIAVSQMRPRTVQKSLGWGSRLFAGIRVMLFFCILHIFDAPLDREHTIVEHGRFLLHLFGLDLWI